MHHSFDEACKSKGMKIRSKGRGKGLGLGDGQGPMGVPKEESETLFDRVTSLTEAGYGKTVAVTKSNLTWSVVVRKVEAAAPPTIIAAFAARGDAEAFAAEKRRAPLFKVGHEVEVRKS